MKYQVLNGITCWLGHTIPQEEWITRRITLDDGSDGVEHETRCECGETIRVRLTAQGEIIEETNDF